MTSNAEKIILHKIRLAQHFPREPIMSRITYRITEMSILGKFSSWLQYMFGFFTAMCETVNLPVLIMIAVYREVTFIASSIKKMRRPSTAWRRFSSMLPITFVLYCTVNCIHVWVKNYLPNYFVYIM